MGLVPSGPDHAFVLWIRMNDGQTVGDLRLQRIAIADGSAAPGWPVDGLLVKTGVAYDAPPTFLSDGRDGILFSWRDAGTIKGWRYLADATLASGWPAVGLPLLDGTAQPSAGDYYLTANDDDIIVAWSDLRAPTHVRVRWLLHDGSPDPGRVETNATPTPLAGAVLRGITQDGSGGVYVGWMDAVTGPAPNYQPYMVSHANGLGVVDVPPSTSRGSLALAAPWPNPARDAFSVRLSLANEAPASVELIEVAGHRVRSQVLVGAGERLVRFDGLEGLAAGMYFLRVEQAGDVRSTRVALVR